jgi:hypothetical protein
MEVVSLLLCLIGTVGMTQIIVESEISSKFKSLIEKIVPVFLMKMLNCYQCSGFWSGIFMGLIFFFPPQLSFFDVGKVFAVGCAGSCLSYFYAMLLMYIEANTQIKVHE